MNFVAPGMDPVLFNIRGDIVERTPYTHPYNYDPFVLYKHNWTENDRMVYSDRLREWEPEQYDTALKGAGIASIYSAKHKQLEKFLQLYFNKPEIALTGVEQQCNQFNGIPYQTYYFRD